MLGLNRIYQGDCLQVLKDIDDNSIDAVITDPPYELGFMGKSWDSTGIANNVEIWKSCLRVLKPGGYLLSFGGTRTYHRMACAIEDAGFEIRDMVEWIYGSGFPKSLNIGKAIDNIQGNEREELVNPRWSEKYPNGPGGNLNPEKYGQCKRIVGNPLLTSKGTSQWEGWGTALKPAHEPICMARKSLSEKTVAENVLKWGTGGINIDECRVGVNGGYKAHSSHQENGIKRGADFDIKMSTGHPINAGRFPANLIHDGSDVVMAEFEKYKIHGAGFGRKGGLATDNANSMFFNNRQHESSGMRFGDSGTPARFFKPCEWTEEDNICSLCSLPLSVKYDTMNICKYINVNNVEKNLKTIQAIIESIAHLNAEGLPSKQFVQNVKSAGNLCEKCATLIAVALVEIKTLVFSQEELQVMLGYIGNSKRCILIQNLVSFAELWENIDIIPTMTSLSLLFGFVNPAITNYIQETIKLEPALFLYQAKASKSERDMGLEGFPLIDRPSLPITKMTWCRTCDNKISDSDRDTRPNSRCFCEDKRDLYYKEVSITPQQNSHPTVKPIKLMEYLIKLVTTEKAIVLDPFAGSGSTLIACKNLGRDYIGIEKEADYIEIANKRIEDFTRQLVLV